MHDNTQKHMPQIQALRAFAAICVVLTHTFLRAGLAQQDASLNLHPRIGEFGVDVFFVISGFIMVLVSKNDFGKEGAQWAFMKKRLKRILPLYWLLTFALIFLVVVAPKFIAHPVIDIGYWAKSLLLIPERHPIDGGLRPLLVVGWTLQYEMFFYCLFAISMFFSRRVGLTILLVALIAFPMIRLVGEPQNILLSFYSQWVILEFAAGMCLAILYGKGIRLPEFYKWVLPLIAFVYLLLGWLASTSIAFDRIIYFGIPATLLMAGLTLPEGVGKIPIGKTWQRLGDSSYALYLSHVFVVAALGVLFDKLVSSTWQQQASVSFVFVVVSLVLSCAVGWAIHRLIERPIGKMLSSKPVDNGTSKQSREGLLIPLNKSI